MNLNTAEDAKTYLTFKTSGVNFACDFEDVIRIEAAAAKEITPAPGFAYYMPGTAVADGEVVPVIDTSLRFGTGNGVSGDYRCFIVAKLDPENAYGITCKKCAALVDEVCGSVKYEGELFSPPALNEESFAEYVRGTFVSGGETYYVISPEKLAGQGD